jgi:methionyl-tRNA synthetase
VPEYDGTLSFQSGFHPGETASAAAELGALALKMEEIGRQIEGYSFKEALRLLMEMSSAGNALLQFNEPWKTIKETPELVKSVMGVSLQVVTALSVLMRPFMPEAAARLRKMLDLPDFSDQSEWEGLQAAFAASALPLPIGHTIGTAAHLFSRVPDELIEAQIAKLHQTESEPTQAPAVSHYQPLKEMIQYDDFAKMDIRTGTILTAEKMEKSKKLLKLQIDLGFEQRTVLSGIAEHFSPEEVIGQQVILLANLAPRMMMGVESQGMILMAENPEGKLTFVAPGEKWPSGMSVK